MRRASTIASTLVLLALAGCGDKAKTTGTGSSAAPPAASPKAPPGPASASTAPTAPAASTETPPVASSAPAGPALPAGPLPEKFVRERPEERAGVDACAFIGGLGFACVDALLAEKDPVKQRYMRRLSDADARLGWESFQKGEETGVAHAEMAMFCAESGPCKQKNPDGVELDDGYACLTKAQAAYWQKDPSSQAAHERACKCDAARAQIPVMGGFLACDGPDKPVVRAKDMPLDEAQDIRACGECDHEKGPAACQREIDRLKDKDLEVAIYLKTVHAPRCAQP